MRAVVGVDAASDPGPATVWPDHIQVDLDSGAGETSRGCADVLYGIGEPELAVQLSRRYPGCLLVSVRGAVDGRCVVLLRGGARIAAGRVRSGREHAMLCSVLHACLAEFSSARESAAVPASGPRPTG